MLRSALRGERGTELRSDTPLREVSRRNPRNLFKHLERETELRLPVLEMTALGVIGLRVCFVAVVAIIVTLREGTWAAVALASLCLALGAGLMATDPLRLPAHVLTMGDLVRRVAPLNVGRLKATGRRAPDAWTTLVGLAADHSTVAPSEISRGTFLMEASLKAKAVAG
jgi:hypothetical protein